eukprot:7319248-Pyramimonas_sp.AAC.1
MGINPAVGPRHLGPPRSDRCPQVPPRHPGPLRARHWGARCPCYRGRAADRAPTASTPPRLARIVVRDR